MTAREPSAALLPVLDLLFEGAERGAWRKCIVTPARQAAAFVPWEKLTAQPVRLSRGTAVKVVTRSGKKEATSTLSPGQWRTRLLEAIELGPCHLDVLANAHDWHARRTRDGRWLVSKGRPSFEPDEAGLPGPAPHDRQRQHPLRDGDPRVRALFIAEGIFGKNGALLGESAAKYRQVQHYIELLRSLPAWQPDTEVRIVDAGCGKAYLSLALCLWAETQGVRVRLTGVDSSSDVIATVRGVAAQAGIEAEFVAAPIAEFVGGRTEPVDILLSLHACDTATDEALAAGVQLGAGTIVLVPCCHRELVAQVEAAKDKPPGPPRAWRATLRSGLLTHRLADIVTDSLRAAALEGLGYRVDVLEFVSAEATARNLMLRARKTASTPNDATRRALERYRALADEWRVKPALESLLGDAWPGGSEG